MTSRPSIEAIRAGLLGRIGELANLLAPDQARVHGNDRWSLNPTRPDRHANSFKIEISGPNQGRWKEFNGDEGGDLINLIAYCRFSHLGHYKDGRGEAVKASIRWAAEWLGLVDADPARVAAAERQAARVRADMVREAEREDARLERNAGIARKHWFDASVSAWDHPVSLRYLEEVRGISKADLSWVPQALRFEPGGPPADYLVQSDPETGEVFPAIITCAVNAHHNIRSVHRTFLMPDGSGKAPLGHSAKRMYGPARGCALRLTRGASGLPPRQAAEKGIKDVLAISEGIEDGLSWACMHPEHRVWAAGSLSNLGAVPIPDCASSIIVLGQNDEKQAARDAFDREAQKLIDRFGGPIEVVRPADPAIKDWNDLWRGV